MSDFACYLTSHNVSYATTAGFQTIAGAPFFWTVERSTAFYRLLASAICIFMVFSTFEPLL